jgi:hypothetical protein
LSKDQIQQKLKGLSLQQKQELLEALKTKELLKKEAILETFKPHPGQLAFLESQSRIVAAFSGNGWGKTTALTLKIIYAHNPSRNPYSDTSNTRHSWLVVPGLDKAEDYWQEIKKWCPPSLLPKPNKLGTSNVRRFEWPNGTMTTIYSHDQDSAKLEGSNIDMLFCDEPPPRSLWIAAFRGLRNNPDYRVVLAGTPVSEPWLYQEIYAPGLAKKDPNIHVIQGSTYDNPYLSKDFISDFEKRLTEDEKRVRLHGEFAHLQGRVFKEFSRQTHVFNVQSWPKEWPVYVAIDPHPRKPNCVLYVGITPEDVLVTIDEIVLEGTPEDLAEAMRTKEKANGYQVVCRRIDNSGSGTDWSRDSFVSRLDQWSRDNNYNVRVNPMRRAEKDVANSIQKIKLLLKNNEIRFLENCTHMISDMELYAWQDYRSPETNGLQEKPRKIHDDMIDPLRYIVVSNPVHSPSMGFLSTLETKTPYAKPKMGPKPRLNPFA